MQRSVIVSASTLLASLWTGCATDLVHDDELAMVEQDLLNSKGRYVATSFAFQGFGVALDPYSRTFENDGAGQRIQETAYQTCGGFSCSKTHLLRPRWGIGDLPPTAGTYTIKVVARRNEPTGDTRFRLFWAENTAGAVHEFRLDGSDIGATCSADSTAWRTCRAFYNKPSYIGAIYVSSQDIDNTTADTQANVLVVDSIEVIPGYCPAC